MENSGPLANDKHAAELFELKHRAMEYYNNNGVPSKIEEILNSTFYDKPCDVYGHLANYFEEFAKIPTISKIIAREVLDSRGQNTLQTEVYCTVKNKEKLQSCCVSSTESYPCDTAKPEEKAAAEEEREKCVEAAVNYTCGIISANLTGLDPIKQKEADDIVLESLKKLHEEKEEKLAKEKEQDPTDQPVSPQPKSPRPPDSPSKTKPKSAKGKNKSPAIVIIPDEPREKFFCGCNAASAVSQSVCQSAAAIRDVPLYKHIASIKYSQVPDDLCLPLPMVTILASGKTAPGKLNCVKEFMVIPKPGTPIKESIKHIMGIYNHCAKTLSAKAGVIARNVNDVGALCPQFDKAEQGLDMLQDAITQLGLTPGEDFHLALNCAGHEMFDFDKGKYEPMAGQQKVADDLTEFWAELLGRYPSVLAIIDPMRKQDKEPWMRLCEKISEKCYVFGDYVYHRPGLLKNEEVEDDFKSSGVVLRMEHMTTISDLLTVTNNMQDAENLIVLSASAGDTPGTFLADLAVGCQARFLKLGAPCRGEKIAKLNRLVQVEEELRQHGRLSHWDNHVFTLIKPLTPPPLETDEAGNVVTDSKGDTKK